VLRWAGGEREGQELASPPPSGGAGGSIGVGAGGGGGATACGRVQAGRHGGRSKAWGCLEVLLGGDSEQDESLVAFISSVEGLIALLSAAAAEK